MRTLIAATVVLASLALPAAALAKPNQTDRQNAAKECRLLHPKGGGNAFGKCVSRRAQDEERERKNARTNAAKECRELHPKGGGNAFGKCVSERASKKKAAADRRDRQQIRRRNARS